MTQRPLVHRREQRRRPRRAGTSPRSRWQLGRRRIRLRRSPRHRRRRARRGAGARTRRPASSRCGPGHDQGHRHHLEEHEEEQRAAVATGEHDGQRHCRPVEQHGPRHESGTVSAAPTAARPQTRATNPRYTMAIASDCARGGAGDRGTTSERDDDEEPHELEDEEAVERPGTPRRPRDPLTGTGRRRDRSGWPPAWDRLDRAVGAPRGTGRRRAPTRRTRRTENGRRGRRAGPVPPKGCRRPTPRIFTERPRSWGGPAGESGTVTAAGTGRRSDDEGASSARTGGPFAGTFAGTLASRLTTTTGAAASGHGGGGCHSGARGGRHHGCLRDAAGNPRGIDASTGGGVPRVLAGALGADRAAGRFVRRTVRRPADSSTDPPVPPCASHRRTGARPRVRTPDRASTGAPWRPHPPRRPRWRSHQPRGQHCQHRGNTPVVP